MGGIQQDMEASHQWKSKEGKKDKEDRRWKKCKKGLLIFFLQKKNKSKKGARRR